MKFQCQQHHYEIKIEQETVQWWVDNHLTHEDDLFYPIDDYLTAEHYQQENGLVCDAAEMKIQIQKHIFENGLLNSIDNDFRKQALHRFAAFHQYDMSFFFSKWRRLNAISDEQLDRVARYSAFSFLLDKVYSKPVDEQVVNALSDSEWLCFYGIGQEKLNRGQLRFFKQYPYPIHEHKINMILNQIKQFPNSNHLPSDEKGYFWFNSLLPYSSLISPVIDYQKKLPDICLSPDLIQDYAAFQKTYFNVDLREYPTLSVLKKAHIFQNKKDKINDLIDVARYQVLKDKLNIHVDSIQKAIFPAGSFNQVSIQPLMKSNDFALEGEYMQHCMSRSHQVFYGEAVMGKKFFFSLTNTQNNTRSTLTINHCVLNNDLTFYVHDHKAQFDESVEDTALLEAAQHIADKINQSFSSREEFQHFLNQNYVSDDDWFKIKTSENSYSQDIQQETIKMLFQKLPMIFLEKQICLARQAHYSTVR